ncbi:MAG TPA: FAD-linked oxidase C-terminal domain-containing protein [Candidatus Limnocylindrales bacterium]|nr:FAD-linked oxidase C-terminal domain-containing protein [Candidatus Limnocylindrales bacterium]
MSTLRVLTPAVEKKRGPVAVSKVDVPALERELQGQVAGEVRFDRGSLGMYAVDASNYRQVPIGVVVPKNLDDVVATVRVARQFGAPILSRGGGTSLAGQCCNTALVIDWSKYVNEVLEINSTRRIARVRPGCILDKLRNAASGHGLTFGPDPATHDHCTLGGMLGNNSCGVHAQMAGAVSNNVESMDVLLYDGTRMTVGWMSEKELEEGIRRGGRVGNILAGIKNLRLRYAGEIRRRFPPIPRRISGYNLDQLLPDADGKFNLARALVGSEGTLVTILEAELDLIHNPPFQTLLVLGYRDVYEAGDHVPVILESKPMGFEGIDHKLIMNMKQKGMHTKYLNRLPEGRGWLLVQFPGETQEESDAKARQLMARLKRERHAPSMKLYDNPEDEKAVWEVRESGLGATAFVPGEPPAWPGWEDSAVPPDRVGDYLRDLCRLMERHGYEAALYGHFGMGCIHCRISFDLTSNKGIKNYRAFAVQAAELVTRYGGSLSGEHGDGQARGELLPIMFGNQIVQAFREFKSLWDPDWKMNPGKIVDANPLDSNLRLGAEYSPWEPATHFKFPEDDGSFAHATLRCVGVGKCRRHSSDVAENQTMCPSFMATHEERHTTRGRAHLLWEMLQGDVIKKGWRDDNVKEALDLCLSCKGCKADCPVNVDMATYKAEFLSHYWQGRIRPRYAYAFGWIDKWARMASAWPGLVNIAASTPGIREAMKAAAGISQQRSIPEFAPETFKSWFRKREGQVRSSKRVVLFPDTFNNFFLPRTARAAVSVLENAGYQVLVPTQHICCGRPLYDYGFLDMAKEYLENVMSVLMPYIDSGAPVVVLEPSCWSVLRDEINGLFPGRRETRKIMENTFLLSEFLVQRAEYRPPVLHLGGVMHAHCHHKSIVKGAEHEQTLLEKMQMGVRALTDGCCGMAGAFGYEEGHYDVSQKIGEHALAPAVRRSGRAEVIIADGFSCREQIAAMTDRQALHMAEVMELGLRHGPGGPGGLYPETEFVREHEAALRKAKLETAATLGGLAAASVAAVAALSRLRNGTSNGKAEPGD